MSKIHELRRINLSEIRESFEDGSVGVYRKADGSECHIIASAMTYSYQQAGRVVIVTEFSELTEDERKKLGNPTFELVL